MLPLVLGMVQKMDKITAGASSNIQGDQKELGAPSTVYVEDSVKPSCEALVL